MYPNVSIGSYLLPTFVLAALVGLAVCAAFLWRRNPAFGFKQVDMTNSAAFGMLGLVFGGKLLYALTRLPDFLLGGAQAVELLGGNVYYGGLFGFAAAIYWYLRRYKLNAPLFFDCIAPAIPLFHIFGRIGCFFNGCCYGTPSERFGVAYTHSLVSQNGVPYLPVQLYESAAETAIFIAVYLYEKKWRGQGKAFWFYCALYSIVRFALEFLRADEIRGFVGALSTSQWISVLLLLASVFMLRKPRRADK